MKRVTLYFTLEYVQILNTIFMIFLIGFNTIHEKLHYEKKNLLKLYII